MNIPGTHASYFPSVADRCKRCGKYHKLQIHIPHDLHVAIKRAAAMSKWGNMTDFVIFTFLDKLGLSCEDMGVARPVIPPMRERMLLSELMSGDFVGIGKKHDVKVAGRTKKQIIQAIADLPELSVVADMKVPRCSVCKKIDHNAKNCPKTQSTSSGKD